MSFLEVKEKIEALIEGTVEKNGSDLHLSAGFCPFIRVNGELFKIKEKEIFSQEELKEILKFLIGENKYHQFLSQKDIDFSYFFKKQNVRVRGNAFIQQGNFSISLRIIPKIKTLKELNLPSILENFALKEQGFFLVVGPVGHGKSTTLASMIEIINRKSRKNILTIENPIEFIFESKNSFINQRDVGNDAYDFKSALRSSFRQDVDVIMIGEMRDPETISTAVTAAETGHLVLSTLHTNNAAQTLNRIIDSFPSTSQEQIRVQLSGSLVGIFSQRLIPRIKGGLIPAYELLINTSAVANLIREGKIYEIETVIETNFEIGMMSFEKSLADLVKKGEIKIEDAFRYSYNQKNLNLYL